MIPSIRRAVRAEQALYQSLLSSFDPPFLVFDLGANVGHSCQMFLNLGAKVICVEPEKKNLEILHRRFGGNKSVQIVEEAIGNQAGERVLFVQDTGTALHTIQEDWKSFLSSNANDRWADPISFSSQQLVQTNTLRQLINRFGRPDFLKIDVEGNELEVLETLDQPIPLVCFEANLPQFAEMTTGCIRRLASISPTATFNYTDGKDLLSNTPMNAAQMEKLVERTPLRYMDICCWMPPSPQ